MRISMLIGTGALLATLGVQASNLSVMGNWFQQLGSSDLIGGAGTDLRSLSEGSASITITDTDGLPWTLMVHHSGGTLPAGVTVALRRTTGGGCGGLVSGLEYQDVGEKSQAFFSGAGDCSDIAIQVRLQGVSIRQAPGVYETTLFYTLQ